MRDGVNNAVSKLKTTANLYGQSEDLFEEIPEGASKGIDNGLPKIEESTKRMNEQTVTTTKKTSEINSPSKVFERLGIFIPQGFANGIKNGIQQVANVIKNMCTQAISTAKTGLYSFHDIFNSVFSNSLGLLKTFCISLKSETEKGLKAFPDIFKSAFSLSSSHLNDFTNNMKNTAKSGISEMTDIIKSPLSVLSSEISNMQNPFENYFGNILDKANSFKSDFLNTMWNVRDSLGDVFYNISVDCWNFGESLNSNLKNALNQMIGSFNTVFQGLNSISYALSAIPGYNLSFDIPEIPYLAKGGVVSSPTLSMIGESGKEAVLPLQNNTGWITDISSKLWDSMKYTFQSVLAQNKNQTLKIHILNDIPKNPKVEQPAVKSPVYNYQYETYNMQRNLYTNQAENQKQNNSLPPVNVYLYPNSRAFKRDVLNAYREEIARGGKIS